MDFSIEIREREGLRTLHFETGAVQGAMWIGQPWALALEYTIDMMAGLLMRDASLSARKVLREGGGEATGHPPAYPSRVLLIGLGAGAQAKFLYRHCPQAQLTVVEIAPRVVQVAREYFELPDDPARLSIVIGDGAEYMQATGETYDLILLDGFNEYGHPGELNTLPFYQACRRRLSDQGLLVVNLIGLSDRVRGGFVHIETAFDHRAVMFPRCRSGNTIAFAATGERIDLTLDELKDRARALEARTGIALLPTLDKLDGSPVCQQGRLVI